MVPEVPVWGGGCLPGDISVKVKATWRIDLLSIREFKSSNYLNLSERTQFKSLLPNLFSKFEKSFLKILNTSKCLDYLFQLNKR